MSSRTAAAVVMLVISFGALFAAVLVKLVRDWAVDENYSHGFLIIPLSAYLIWERRARLTEGTTKPSFWGLVLVAISVAVLLVGVLGAELFLTRVAMIGCIAGGVVFVLGWRHLKMLLFPIALLFLMVPIPAIVFNQIVFPLQLFASRVGELSLSTLGIPVLREGNIIVLANTSLDVVEACSGIRSLVSLLTLGIVLGYFMDPRNGVRATIALLSVPVAILANGVRVAGTGIAAHYYGAEAATGFLHEFAGWMVFVVAFLMLFGILRVIKWILPSKPSPSPAIGQAAWTGAK